MTYRYYLIYPEGTTREYGGFTTVREARIDIFENLRERRPIGKKKAWDFAKSVPIGRAVAPRGCPFSYHLEEQ